MAQIGERLFGWWWWRSPNRPQVTDSTYLRLLEKIPLGVRGLDLGSREPVRSDALTLDVVPVRGVDVAGDGARLPFATGSFRYVWSNAVLEHVPRPWVVAKEIYRVLEPGGWVFVQVPFLENVHSEPHDYYRFTENGLRILFEEFEIVAAGVSAGPGQVLPDLLQYYATGFSELQKGSVWINLLTIFVGFWLLPIRWLDGPLQKRPTWWKWARGVYLVARKPVAS